MKNIRFKDDEKLSEIYEKINLVPFRNYIYNFDGLGTYCNYLDEYECAIDDRDDKIEKYKEVIDKAIKLLGNYRHYSTPDEKQNSDNEDLVNKAFDILKEEE